MDRIQGNSKEFNGIGENGKGRMNMNKKPYYDPITKETYHRETAKIGNLTINIKMITGSFVLGSHDVRPSRWYNELGECVKEEECIEYVKIIKR